MSDKKDAEIPETPPPEAQPSQRTQNMEAGSLEKFIIQSLEVRSERRFDRFENQIRNSNLDFQVSYDSFFLSNEDSRLELIQDQILDLDAQKGSPLSPLHPLRLGGELKLSSDLFQSLGELQERMKSVVVSLIHLDTNKVEPMSLHHLFANVVSGTLTLQDKVIVAQGLSQMLTKLLLSLISSFFEGKAQGVDFSLFAGLLLWQL